MIKTYNIEGLSCASCAVSSQKILSKVEGVLTVRVNFATRTAIIESEKEIELEILNLRLEKAGFELFPKDNQVEKKLKETEAKKYKALKTELLIAAAFAIPLFIVSMFLHSIIHQITANYIMLGLTLPIIIISGKRFYTSAWNLLKIGQSNMDSLVAIGTGTAFLFSLFNTFFPSYLSNQGFIANVYYETAGIIIFFILLGKFFEENAKNKTSSAIKSLLNLQVSKVTILIDEKEQVYPVEAIQENEIILVRPGERIPLDGLIIFGMAEIDESMLSGEAMPKLKTEGDLVFAGTINGNSSFQFKVLKTVENTVLYKLIKLVEEAQSSQAPVQKLVDKISAIFVPSVILTAFISASVWAFIGPEPKIIHAIISAVSVLVIACPCALGLATPTAIMVGIGRAASKGMLIKGFESLQSAQEIDVIVFDKTGTLTEGKPQVIELKWYDSNIHNKIILASLEKNSEHPLSKAIFNHLNFKSDTLQRVDNFSVKSGRGIKGLVNGKQYYAGNLKWINENGIELSEEQLLEFNEFSKTGTTLIIFTDDSSVLAILSLSDRIRKSSIETINALNKMGIELHILTGDNKKTASSIASNLGIKNYKADLLPSDKIDFIKHLQKEGKKTAMIGDGINDAPALAQADLGIAMNSGSDIALESADIILLHNDPLQILDAIKISKNTMSVLKQNLFWAFFYNILGIPIAAGVLYPVWGILLDPMLAGAAMAFSSVSVVLNSLRIRA